MKPLRWWVVWVLVSVPAGALAGVGLTEFNWGGPPYDGGFLGDLVLFGGFLAAGQASFLAVFVWFLSLRTNGGPRSRYAVVIGMLVWWPLSGLIGWTFGSFVEVFASGGVPLYSPLRVLTGGLRWLALGLVQSVVLTSALSRISNSGDPTVDTAPNRAPTFGAGTAWIVASLVGGLLYESWKTLDMAARANRLNEAIAAFAQGLGVAENVAYVVIPHAIFVPLLYGVPTGVVFAVIHKAFEQRFAAGE